MRVVVFITFYQRLKYGGQLNSQFDFLFVCTYFNKSIKNLSELLGLLSPKTVLRDFFVAENIFTTLYHKTIHNVLFFAIPSAKTVSTRLCFNVLTELEGGRDNGS